MLCHEIMSREVRWISEQDTALTAARVMRDANIGFLPVRDASGRVIGAITDRDITTRLVASEWPGGTLVSELMTREVVACSPDDDVTHAQQLMRNKRKFRVLCIDEGGHVVGIISLADIALYDDGWRTAHTMRQIARREVSQRPPSGAGH